jgi:hypothetical protein
MKVSAPNCSGELRKRIPVLWTAAKALLTAPRGRRGPRHRAPCEIRAVGYAHGPFRKTTAAAFARIHRHFEQETEKSSIRRPLVTNYVNFSAWRRTWR